MADFWPKPASQTRLRARKFHDFHGVPRGKLERKREGAVDKHGKETRQTGMLTGCSVHPAAAARASHYFQNEQTSDSPAANSPRPRVAATYATRCRRQCHHKSKKKSQDRATGALAVGNRINIHQQTIHHLCRVSSSTHFLLKTGRLVQHHYYNKPPR